MIIIKKLSVAYGNQTIFDNISATINPHDRIGLVGNNGAGKSTLLKLISCAVTEPEPEITINNQCRIAYLSQHVVLESERSIIDETCATFHDAYHAHKERIRLEPLVENNPDLLESYSVACDQEREHNFPALKAQAIQMLLGLGFKQTDMDRPVANLSGGWRMRIVLAKLLLENADFYLFDEPTNHLDLHTKEWLVQFLKSASFGFMLVCHEKYILNQVCDKILELERGHIQWYPGNYNQYVQQKEAIREKLEQQYHAQQKEIAHKKTLIDKFRAKASKASFAQSLIKELERMEKIEPPTSTKSVSFSFPITQNSGKVVLKVEEVAHSFGSTPIFKNASFEIQKGQKVALIAPNGMGKSTLFNILAGIYACQKGSVEYGYNVKHALFAQEQSSVLDKNLSVLDNAYNDCPEQSRARVRSTLGAFLFTDQSVHKKVSVLSGGEQNRLGMVKVLLSGANLLLLDEPTNHLDIPSKQVLLNALQSYQGTIVFVCHDHDFINNLADHIIDLTPEQCIMYPGTYQSYQEYTRALNQPTQVQTKATTPAHSLDTNIRTKYPQQKRLVSLERSIAKIEHEMEVVQNSFADIQFGSDLFNTQCNLLKKLKTQHEQLFTEWQELIS